MEYKYKAFISYRHIAPDMQAAERLQKLLEAYKPPKSLGKKKENWRIFRDVSELQSSNDLSEIIRNAIESSEFLIVICSPQYTDSKWCLQELTRFRELHGNKNTNIITMLVNGDPRESFPEELTRAEMTTTNEKGEEVTVMVDVEPLAANIVSDNLKDSMKKLNTEFLRIAAPLLGCDFNDLFQREKRREAARRRRIFGSVSAILSLITIISVASAVTINGKNKQIQTQNDQILLQNDQIKAQNAEIETKNSELLVENAEHLAVESENLFKENNLIQAIKKAIAALPTEDADKPVLPEAEYALSRELGSFSHTQFAPQLSLKHECAVEQLSFMGGGKSIVSADATGVYFWNAETGDLIRKISASDSEFASDSGNADKLTACFDISPDKTGTAFKKTSAPSYISYQNHPVFYKIFTNYVHNVGDDEPGTGGDVYIYNSDCDLWRIDGASGEVKWSTPKAENAFSCHDVIINEASVLRLYREKKVLPGGTVIMGDDFYLEIIDRETGRITDTVKLELSSSTPGLYGVEIKGMHDGIIYISQDDQTLEAFAPDDRALEPVSKIAVNYPLPAGINKSYLLYFDHEPVVAACSVLAFGRATDLIRYDKDMKEQKWRVSLPVNYQNNGKSFLIPADHIDYAHDVLAVTTGSSISLVDYETGELIKNIPVDGEIVDVSFSGNGLIMFTLNSGEEYMLSINSYTTGDDADHAAYKVQTFSTNISLFSYSAGKYVTAGNYSNIAYIQYPKQNEMFRDIETGKWMYERNILAVTDDGAKAAVVSTFFPDNAYKSLSDLTHHLFIYDAASGECSEVTALENYKVNSAAFLSHDKLIVNANKPDSSESIIMSVSLTDGKAEAVRDAPLPMHSEPELLPAADGAYYLADYDKNIVHVSADGSVKAWAEKDKDTLAPDRKILNGMYAVSGSRAAVYAQINDGDSRTELTVHDFSGGQDLTLECSLSGTGREIRRIFWQNPDTVGVFFNDRTVSLFDADTGSLKTTVSLNGTSQEPVSAAAVSDDTFAVLCRDSNLYEMNAEGFTGRKCRLDFAGDRDNEIYESDSSAASNLEIRPSADKSRIYAVWDKSQAWLIDTSRFSVRYRIDNFAAAPSEGNTVYISDSVRNKTGLFPIYTTQQLTDAANAYLSALGEA